MIPKRIKVTSITLRNNEQFFVSVEEGEKIRQAKKNIASAGKISEPLCIKSQNNRMIESSFIVDIKDKYIDNPNFVKKDDSKTYSSVDINKPGYKRFLEMRKIIISRVTITENENNNKRADAVT